MSDQKFFQEFQRTAIQLATVNMDRLYHSLSTERVIVNDIDIFNTQNKEMLDGIILKNYSEDNISIIPSCTCGELKGAYYVGDVCHKCSTTVVSSIEDNISFLLWLKRPQEVERFISPIILAILMNRYKITKPNVQLIKYIMLPNFAIDKRQQKSNLPLLEKLDHLLKQNNIKRGYNSFIQNFFTIIHILEAEFVKKKQSEKDVFIQFLMDNKENIFFEHLPFPNKIMFVIDNNELGKFMDKSLLNPINVIRRVTGIDLYTRPGSVKQTKIARSLIDISEFYIGYIKSTFFSKPALIRQHVTSSRSHFTGRAVITGIDGPHRYDEIRLPWSLSCSLFREHILNRLYRRGFTYKNAVNFLQYHNKIFNPILNEIFIEIVASGSPKGIPCLFNRNPSLHRGSIQTVYISQIKPAIDDNTIGMSLLIAPSFNADVDGDEMNITLALTKKVIDQLDNFDPHHNVLSMTGPNEFTSNIKLPKTIVSTLSNWLG